MNYTIDAMEEQMKFWDSRRISFQVIKKMMTDDLVVIVFPVIQAWGTQKSMSTAVS